MQERVKKLIELQEKKGFSDTQMGAFLDVSYATYVRWIKERTNPRTHLHIKNIDRLLSLQT